MRAEDIVEVYARIKGHPRTAVIIAHRLNTIENADEIFFVNSGEVNRAGSLDDAMNMLLKGNRAS